MGGRKLFTFDEVKKYLKVNRSTLYKFVQEGRIPALKLGRQWRFDLSEIDDRLKQQSRAYKENRQKQLEGQRLKDDESKRAIEKRQFFRLINEFPVKYSLNENPEEIFNATGRNISEGGIFIEPEALRDKFLSSLKGKKRRLRLVIELPEKGDSTEIYSEIVWLSEGPFFRNKIGIGLKFLDLLSETTSRISSYILKHSISQNGMPALSVVFPIRRESTIVVKRRQEEVYNLLKDIEKFPEFIKGINSVEIIGETEKGVISDWRMNIDGLPVRWRQLDILDEKGAFIRFRMLDGDLERYTGEWRLTELLTGTEIRLSIAVDWGVHCFRRYMGPILEGKTEDILQGMLEGIKKRLWTEKTPGLVKFAFVVHPYDLEVIHAQFDEPACQTKRRVFLEKIFECLPPFECAHVTGIQSLTGKQIDGELIYCPFLPNQILNLDSHFILERIIETAKIAEKIGAKIVGLGAYAAGVGRKGILVAKALNIPVTTGTSYTIVMVIEATLKAAREIGIELSQAKVAVIGATGAIGQVCSQILANNILHLTLVARNKEKLDNLAETIRKNTEAKVEVTREIDKAIRDADIILTATSTPGTLIDLSLLHPGTLICDISVPKNISQEVANSRRDILVVDGGVVRPPGDVNFNFYFGLPPGLCYACMAETMILALEERYECYSIGGNISLDKVKGIQQLGFKHGFKLAELRSFGKLISPSRIEQVKEVFEKRQKYR